MGCGVASLLVISSWSFSWYDYWNWIHEQRKQDHQPSGWCRARKETPRGISVRYRWSRLMEMPGEEGLRPHRGLWLHTYIHTLRACVTSFQSVQSYCCFALQTHLLVLVTSDNVFIFSVLLPLHFDRVLTKLSLCLCSPSSKTSISRLKGCAVTRKVMAAYRRVYDSHHLQADCREPGSAPEPYAR